MLPQLLALYKSKFAVLPEETSYLNRPILENLFWDSVFSLNHFKYETWWFWHQGYLFNFFLYCTIRNESNHAHFLFILGDKLFLFQHLTEMHLGCIEAWLQRAIPASLLASSVWLLFCHRRTKISRKLWPRGCFCSPRPSDEKIWGRILVIRNRKLT